MLWLRDEVAPTAPSVNRLVWHSPPFVASLLSRRWLHESKYRLVRSAWVLAALRSDEPSPNARKTAEMLAARKNRKVRLTSGDGSLLDIIV